MLHFGKYRRLLVDTFGVGQVLLLGYKTKNAVQKSTPPEVKIHRYFHPQMQFLINKLHFPNKKAPTFQWRLQRGKIFRPSNPKMVLGQTSKEETNGQALFAPSNVRPWSHTSKDRPSFYFSVADKQVSVSKRPCSGCFRKLCEFLENLLNML